MEMCEQAIAGEISASNKRVGCSRPREGQPFFTVFVPTYNRAALLPRLLDSIAAQTFQDFELLIVDDGSTDNTQQILSEFAKHARFPVRIHCQTNQGLTSTINVALDKAEGFLFVKIDDDSTLVPTALDRFHYWWHAAQELFSEPIVCVEALLADINTGKVIGTPYPQSPMLSDHIEIYYGFNRRGDPIRAIRTDIPAKYRYPRFAGENFIPEAYLWNRVGFERHKAVYINEVLSFTEYRADGMCRNFVKYRVRNPRGFELYYRDFLQTAIHDERVSYKALLRHACNWVRSCLHLSPSVGKVLRYTWKNIPRRSLWFPAAVVGIGLWMRDRWVLSRARFPQ